jgi:2'-5' RNA ligase superfamily
VGPYRQRYDPVAQHGVPAHVTVLYPFREDVDDEAAARVGRICSTVPAFEVEFATTGRFPGVVVWLRPEPSRPFTLLTQTLAAEFPDCPPYAGLVPDPIPHLTVAINVDELTASALEAVLAEHLPVRSLVEGLALLTEADGRWEVGRSWPLAARSDTA